MIFPSEGQWGLGLPSLSMLRLFQPDENQIKKRATRHEIIVDHSTEIEREKQHGI